MTTAFQDNASQDNDVAIIGMALRVPGADDPGAFWTNLCNGVESITEFSEAELAGAGIDPGWLADPRYVRRKAVLADVAGFDAAFFGYAPREAACLDPQQRLMLECAWSALEHAGHSPDGYPGAIGVYAGTGMSAYLLHHLHGNPAVAETTGPFEIMLANSGDSLPTRVSYKLDLKGPSVNVQTACSSSLVAVHLAVQALLNGECGMALAGGVSVDLPLVAGYWHQEGMILSPDGHCRPFDAQGRGTVSGSGVGVVVLKRLADALADRDTVHAVIKGTAVNTDGAEKIGFTAPSPEGQAAVIAEALAVSGVPADSIGYVEGHGTATPLGDPVEVAALTHAFREQTARRGFCALGSLKGNMGHLNTAAGVVGLIKAALAVREGLIPPSLHFNTPNPQIDFAASPFAVADRLTPWLGPQPRRAGVSSFGMGGTNAHAILEQAPARPPAEPDGGWHILPLSARTPAALEEAARRLAAHLDTHPAQRLADVAHTLRRGRRQFERRHALVARDRGDAVAQLRGAPPAADAPPALLDAARRWMETGEVDWDALAPPHGRIRVPLPAYPFEHRRFWIDPPRRNGTGEAAGEADPLATPPRLPDMADWFNVPVWAEIPAPPTAPLPGGRWLLLADGCGLAERLAERLRAGGASVLLARPGAAFACHGDEATLRIAEPADYDALFDAMAAGGGLPAHIVHGWAITAEGAPPVTLETLDTALECGLHSLLFLVQAMVRRTGRGWRLTIAANHTLEILDEAALRAEKAALLGAAKIVPQEHAEIACRFVDLGPAHEAAALDALLAELPGTEGAATPDVVSWRAGRRWVERFARRPVPEPDRLPLKSGGVYVVTGGLGGMGLAFALELAERAPGARLLLVGRTPLPPEEAWDRVPAGDGRAARSVAGIRAMRAAGAEVMVAAADVADEAAMRSVLDEARRRFGPVNGLLHTAGLPDYEGVIRGRDRVRTDRVIAAKVRGTLVLDRLLAGDPLDFVFLCSSLGTTLYQVKFGQVGYAAANEFLDVHARARRARGGPPTLALNWSDWRESGMSVDALRRWAERQHDDGAKADADGLSDLEGRAVMRRALGLPVARVLVAQHDLSALIRQTPLLAKAFVADASTLHPRPDLAQPYVAPRNEEEQRVAALWARLLGLDRVGAEDDFYDLGGHSLMATQLVSRVHGAFGVEVELDAFLTTPTVACLTTLIRTARGAPAAEAEVPLVRVPRDGPLPLSFAQQRLWVLDQMEPGSATYIMPTALRIRGTLDTEALAGVFTEIVRRHEALRTVFTAVDGEPRQTVRRPRPVAMPVTDLSALPADARDREAFRLAEEEARAPFDLSDDPMLRVRLLRLGADDHVLLVTKHHIASDGWSMGLLRQEMAVLYTAFAARKPSPLPALPVQYADFAQWQRTVLSGRRLEAALSWWRERLEGAPDLVLPVDFPRPRTRSGRGGLIGVPLPAELVAPLDALGRAEGATRFMVLLAAFQLLMQRYSGQEDFCVGTPIANRRRTELEPLIGFFANTLVLRADLRGDPDFRGLVGRVRDGALGAFAHQDLPFERLVEALEGARDAGRNPLFQVLFVLQNDLHAAPPLPGLTLSPLFADTATAKFDLTLSVIPEGDGLRGLFEYNADLFTPETIQTMANHFAHLLSELARRPDDPVSHAALEPADPEWSDAAFAEGWN